MQVTVKNLKNRKVREIDLPEEVFAYPYKEHLIYLAVESFRAKQRRGTHKTKTRGEVRATGRKPWRQKGTGRARAGTFSSPLWRSGGTTHGPQPRSYANKLSVGERKNALKSALSRKLADDGVMVIDSLDLESHKTAELARSLGKLGAGGKVLLVARFDNDNLSPAARNNPKLKTVDAMAVNVYDVVDRTLLVFSEEALGKLVEVLGS
jgi:large subunit ribosomal protein L4